MTPSGARNLTRGLLVTTLLLWLGICGLPPETRAANKIEGYYETEIAMERNDSKWHFGAPSSNGIPKHYAELKFLSFPADNFEAFVKLRAESNRDDDRTPEVDYYAPPWLIAEGHLKIRDDNYEAFLFSRQNRFWINSEPLLSLVEDHKLKNDDWGPKSQGVRLDFWDVQPALGLGFEGTVIYSDDGATYNWGGGDVADGTDSWIIRVMPKLANSDKFSGKSGGWGTGLLGFTVLRKDWTNTSNPDYRDKHHLMHNSVYAVDLAYSPTGVKDTGMILGPLNFEQSRWTVEYAFSSTPFRETVFSEPSSNHYAFAAEFRNIQLSDVILHGWYYDFGENFRDYLSGRFDNDRREFNRQQKHAEAIWLVPRKAVTAKLVYDTHRKRTVDEIGGGLRPATEWYGELYVEFINGFKGKVAHKRYRGYDASAEINDFFTYPEWYAEVSVENFLAKIRLQVRIKDAGTFREITAYGFDMDVNITEKLKGYIRMLNVNEETEARHTMFAQLKYDLGFGAEFYFEYGDAGQSDNIVRTDWFVDEGNNDNLRDRLKLLVKTWF
ncbi:MAG: hypothetical protein ABIF77_11425 [bacterium]